MMKKHIIVLLLPCALAFGDRTVSVTVDADDVVATAKRANLMGINIAVYNSPGDFEKAIAGPIGELETGLIRMPGGSVSDKYYWNGNGSRQPESDK